MGEHRADMDKETTEQLREGIQTADEQVDRLEHEGSEQAIEANREQREAMEEALEDREGASS